MENTGQILSREERKRLKEAEIDTKQTEQVKYTSRKGEEKSFKPKKLRIRLIPIWLRIIIVLVLIVAFFFIGAMIGYGMIGNGNPTDVFKAETWSHIFNIVKEGTE